MSSLCLGVRPEAACSNIGLLLLRVPPWGAGPPEKFLLLVDGRPEEDWLGQGSAKQPVLLLRSNVCTGNSEMEVQRDSKEVSELLSWDFPVFSEGSSPLVEGFRECLSFGQELILAAKQLSCFKLLASVLVFTLFSSFCGSSLVLILSSKWLLL